jgi:hypothetical protein
VLTSLTAPLAPGTTSIVSVGADITGANAALGWDVGGERTVVAPLTAPTNKSVMVGWPVSPDFAQGMNIVIGDCDSSPLDGNPRRDEYTVDAELTMMLVERNGTDARNREHVQTALAAIRQVLQTDQGRQLGRATTGDIVLVTENGTRLAGRPFAFKATNLFFDGALMKLRARVFHRPSAT